jgi:hypothetical protein
MTYLARNTVNVLSLYFKHIAQQDPKRDQDAKKIYGLYLQSVVGKVTLKSNGDEALSDESL